LGSSETTPWSCVVPSAICCGTKRSKTDNGEGCCPPAHRGGQ
jgi:hypothetical protein